MSQSLLWTMGGRAVCVQAHVCATEKKASGCSVYDLGSPCVFLALCYPRQLLLDSESCVPRMRDGTRLGHMSSSGHHWSQHYTHSHWIGPKKRDLDPGEAFPVGYTFLVLLFLLVSFMRKMDASW